MVPAMTNEEYGKIVSKNLKRLAYEKGKMQMEIAKEMGISKATLGAWMNGTRIPKMESIDALANYFGVTRNEIMMPFNDVEYPDDIRMNMITDPFDSDLIKAYHAAPGSIQQAVRKLLDLT